MGNLPIMGELTSFDTNIKFTYEYINKRVSFLDLQVDIVEGNLKLITSLFVKPHLSTSIPSLFVRSP